MILISTVASERTILHLIRNMDFLDFGRGLKNFASTFDRLENYGCNCHALISGKSASGRPVDQLDMACQQYLSCSKCLKKEFEEKCDEDSPYILGFTNFDTSFYRSEMFLFGGHIILK